LDELTCGSNPKDVSSFAADFDGDSVPDCADLFPQDGSESSDFDVDGVGDNADLDDDNDGQNDDLELLCGTDPNSSGSVALDSDSDGEPDCIDTNTLPVTHVGEIYGHYGVYTTVDPIVVRDAPSGQDYVQVAAGNEIAVALKVDGSIETWGEEPNILTLGDTPAGTDFIAVSAYNLHAAALKSDGSLLSWGSDANGEVSGTPPGNNYTAVAAGGDFSVALRSDGSLISWGANQFGQVTNTPAGSGFVAISAGMSHGVALTTDGSVISWGDDSRNQVSQTPTGNGYLAISAGGDHTLAIRADRTIAAWGSLLEYYDSEILEVVSYLGSVVEEAPTDSGYIAIAAGTDFSVAQRADGSLFRWGNGWRESGLILPTNNDVRLINAGATHTHAIKVVS